MRPIDADELLDIAAQKGYATVDDILGVETVAPPPNTPLTLEELRKMDGEPVWAEFPKCPEATGWMLVDVNRHCVHNGLLGDCDFETCGKTWRAYRRKPDEGTRTATQLPTPAWAEHFKARFERMEGKP